MNLTGLATAFLRLLGRLPLPLLHWLSTVLFVLAYYLVRWRTALIDKNLKNAFPNLSATERKKIARSHVRSVIDTTFESLKGNTISTEELGRRVRFTNIELLNDYADQPLFIVGAHQGNWEWQLLALSNILDKPLENYVTSRYSACPRKRGTSSHIENPSFFSLLLIEPFLFFSFF